MKLLTSPEICNIFPSFLNALVSEISYYKIYALAITSLGNLNIAVGFIFNQRPALKYRAENYTTRRKIFQPISLIITFSLTKREENQAFVNEGLIKKVYLIKRGKFIPA